MISLDNMFICCGGTVCSIAAWAAKPLKKLQVCVGVAAPDSILAFNEFSGGAVTTDIGITE